MRSMNRLVAFAALLVMALAVVRPAAAAPNDPPSRFISELGSKAIGVLSDKSIAKSARRQQFETLFVDNFDVQSIGKFVLGRYAKSATPEQMSAYQNVFKDYVVNTYNTRLSSYAGQTLDVIGSSPGENGRTVVKSQINQPAGGTQPIQVDWILTGDPGAYRIVDVVIGGVSMALSQRSEFASVIQNGGGNVDALIERLKQQVAAAQADS
jgi:phospholipid transport system substrate-binding protein